MYIYMYVYVYIYVYIYMYVYIYICAHILYARIPYENLLITPLSHFSSPASYS